MCERFGLVPMTDTESDAAYADLPPAKARVLLVSILIVALCGIVYELIIGTVSSYLMGNSVYQFSLTIGFFMFAMGVGSYLTRFIGRDLIQSFIVVELALALVGGLCSIALFLVFPAAPWLYQTVMLGFIFVIGALVGLEIPLLTRVLAARTGTRKSIADVMSLDYVGALIGAVAFPLFLLPTLGLISSSFAIGLINALVALVNILWLRDRLRSPKKLLLATGAVILTLMLLTLMASRITAYAQSHLYFDQIVWKKQTPYQTLVVTNTWQRGDLRLFIDGNLQFSEMDERRYHEALVHPVMSMPGRVETVLVLGGGDGLAMREILKYPDVKQVDLVDIDPEMTGLGLNFAPLVRLNEASLSDPRVTIYNEDAFVFIRRTRQRYDRVIVDFPDPNNEAISKLYSEEFYAMLRARMRGNAVMVTQSSSPFFARRTYWSIAATIESVFGNNSNYQIAIPSFGVWGFNLAALKTPGRPADFPAGLSFISEATYAAAEVFPPDIQRPEEVVVNSIMDPKLYQQYEKDMRGR